VPIGWNLPKCYGQWPARSANGPAMRISGTGLAIGYSRPEGFELEIELGVVDDISDLTRYVCVPEGI